MFYSSNTFIAAFTLVSLPYLIKDFICIVLGYIVSSIVYRKIKPYNENKNKTKDE